MSETEKILNEHEHKLYLQTYNKAWNAAIDECLKINAQFGNPVSREENLRRLKKMSVKELKFDNGYFTINQQLPDRFVFKIDVPCAVAVLDRNQAHLLMLYLQEHLGYK